MVVGPVCTWRLGQYGAEIVKVESPEGDLMRGLGGMSPTGQHSGTYLHLNRGKRNICLDLKQPGAREAVERLVATADVIVANMRPDALARLGLDAASIRAKYPDKVHCLITGYGTNGPYAGRPTYDSVVQAVTGMAGLMQARDGEPAYMPMLICDHVAGEIAAGAILSALLERKASGNGCSLEVPMFETMATFVLQEHLAQHSFVPPVGFGWDQPIKPADLRQPHLRCGDAPSDIFRILTTGMTGTPMLSFASTLSEEQRWDLAAYVVSLRPAASAGDAAAPASSSDSSQPKSDPSP